MDQIALATQAQKLATEQATVYPETRVRLFALKIRKPTARSTSRWSELGVEHRHSTVNEPTHPSQTFFRRAH